MVIRHIFSRGIFLNITKTVILLAMTTLLSLPLAAQLAIPAHPEVIRSMVAHNDQILVGTFGLGIWRIAPNEITQIKVPHPMISLMQLHDDKLWVATAGGGCFYTKLETNLAVELPSNASFAKLHGMFINDRQPLLIGSVGNGSAILADNTWKPLEASSGSSRNWVNSITLFSDRIFLGTSTGVYHTKYPASVENWAPVKIDGIKGTNHLLAHQNKLYAATNSDGIYEITPQYDAKQVEDSFGQTHFISSFNNQLVAGGKYCLWLIDQGKAQHIEGYNFSEGKCAIAVGDSILIGTMKGEIIKSKDLMSFEKVYEFRQNKLEEIVE